MKNFFQKLLGIGPEVKPEEPDEEKVITAPLVNPAANSDEHHKTPTKPIKEQPVVHLEPPQFNAGCGQSVGKQREINEDSLFLFNAVLSSNSAQIPFGFFLVADGMGGHQHGEVASETAVRVMADYLLRNLYTPLVNPNHNAPALSLQEIMQAGVQEAHQAIMKKTPDGGTTLTGALLMGKQLTVAHVGDSRAYLVDKNGHMKPLTRDHSYVRRLEEMGQITAEEAAIHPQRNVLYRALGQGEPFEPEVQTHRIPQSGYLMICSDGLWSVVTEEQMGSEIATGAPPQMICQKLVDLANEAGGPDNITVILVRLPE